MLYLCLYCICIVCIFSGSHDLLTKSVSTWIYQCTNFPPELSLNTFWYIYSKCSSKFRLSAIKFPLWTNASNSYMTFQEHSWPCCSDIFSHSSLIKAIICWILHFVHIGHTVQIKCWEISMKKALQYKGHHFSSVTGRGVAPVAKEIFTLPQQLLHSFFLSPFGLHTHLTSDLINKDNFCSQSKILWIFRNADKEHFSMLCSTLRQICDLL